MDWKSRGGTSVLDVVTRNSGMTEDELTDPQPTSSENIENMPQAAAIITQAIKQNTPITIMGDYDADGITASAILYLMLQALGVNAAVRLPRRMSEGYGLNETVIDEFKTGLLITVDNGIAAVDAIAKAKSRGFRVLILDHHLSGDTLPDADVIVDPHLNPEKNGFVDYCGAGLAFKLAQLLVGDAELIRQLCSLAAIGTVADSVPLRGDNRYIVKCGLIFMKRKKAPVGLLTLLKAASIYTFTEKDIGFKIGPMLNAAGRMLDEGAMKSLELLIEDDEINAQAKAEELIRLNEERKLETTKGVATVEDIIKLDCLYGDAPLVIYAPGLNEGIIGIITGRVAEAYKVPTFILTDGESPDVLKGSGRSYGGVNLKEDVVDKVSQYLLTGGGHAAAAGISVSLEKYNDMVNAMHDALLNYEAKEQATLEYDLEITPDDVPRVFAELEKYAPYGEGNPQPVFRINNVVLSPKLGELCKYMGKQAQHVKLFTPKFSAVCFDRSGEYRGMGCPAKLDFVGVLSKNVYQYASELQLEVTDLRPSSATKNGSSLLDMLKKNGTI